MIDNTTNIDSIDMILADDSPNISNREASSESVISLKRKCCYDEISLSEQIKRFKITSTPGELRYILHSNFTLSLSHALQKSPTIISFLQVTKRSEGARALWQDWNFATVP